MSIVDAIAANRPEVTTEVRVHANEDPELDDDLAVVEPGELDDDTDDDDAVPDVRTDPVPLHPDDPAPDPDEE